MIKNLAIGKWSKEKTPEGAGEDMISISPQIDRGKILLNNFYSPSPPSHGSNDLGTLLFPEELPPKEGQHILVGDFILHHPIWGCQTVLSHYKLSENLIDIPESKNMELALPKSIITWST